jgi:branched-chain amino acid transport system substrate-binding protein
MALVDRRTLVVGSAALFAPASASAAGATQAPGITDTEIRFGNSFPYSGPISSYGTIGRLESAYFRMVNERGGINGRKLNFISYDDGASPPKTVEQTRRLVEQDGVAFLCNTLGTANNTAIVSYMNQRKIPHLFVASGADKWGDYKDHPWTIGWQPSLRVEAQIYAKFILGNKPGAKIGILYQNDDFGKDYVVGVRDVLGGEFGRVALESYQLTDATIDSQLISLKGAGVDVLVNASLPKFAAMTIRKLSDLEWHPMHVMTNVSISVAAVMVPAGRENGKGIISSAYLKDPTDPAWDDDSKMQLWRDFMRKYYPEGDTGDVYNVYGYGVCETLVHLLNACGSDLSRENIMRQAINLSNLANTIFLPGITLSTSPTNYHPLRQLQMMRWDGKTWIRFGNIIEGANI